MKVLEPEPEEKEEAIPVLAARIGRRTVLYTRDGLRLTPEEAISVAKRMFGQKGATTLQTGGPESLQPGSQ